MEIIQYPNDDELGTFNLSPATFYLPLTYAGGNYDEHTHFIRFGARDYDPTTGRWTAKDPILFAGKLSNLYEYNLNDPINYLDITGLQIVRGGGYYPPYHPYNQYRGYVNSHNSTLYNAGNTVYQSYPVILDGASVIATATGHPYVAVGLSSLSAAITEYQGNREGAIIGTSTSILGLVSKNPRTQLAIGLFQVGYDLLPEHTIVPKEVNSSNNPFGVADNTYVRSDNTFIKTECP